MFAQLRRVTPAIAAVALLAAVAATQDRGASAAPADTREAKVLALLRQLPPLDSEPGPIAASTNQFGCTVIAPAIRGMCGLGWQAPFDPARARTLARELCAIYGLTVAADVQAPGGVPAQLDAFDAARGIGLKLRGSIELKAMTPGGTPSLPTVVDEAAATDLDIAEHRTLAQQQLRIHVADVADYFRARSGDHFATTLCYLATVAAFLNDATDGDDVDFAAILGDTSMVLDIAAPKAQPGLTVATFGGGFVLTVARPLQVTFAFDPRAALVPSGPKAADPATRPYAPREPAKAPFANGGRPTLVAMPGFGIEKGTARATLRQRQSDGKERDLASGDGHAVFAPGAFDTARPFSLALDLAPGSYRFATAIWIGAPQQ